MFEKKVEEVKRHTEVLVEEVKRHTGALVEDLRGDVKAVAEGHGVLDRKIDNLHDELAETKQDIHGIKQELQCLKKDMSIVKNYVIGVDEKLNIKKGKIGEKSWKKIKKLLF